jgi:5-carboxymethyl-2-hydroxymuconate isomerase
MPHITIEYSANVSEHHDLDALVAAVHHAALDHGLPPADGLRTRATRRDHYLVADGSDDLAFVAVQVRIGPGRDEQAKTSFITALLDAAEAQLASESDVLAIAWSIELTEIDPAFRINRNHVRTRLGDR